jgi:hypothetical protein
MLCLSGEQERYITRDELELQEVAGCLPRTMQSYFVQVVPLLLHADADLSSGGPPHADRMQIGPPHPACGQHVERCPLALAQSRRGVVQSLRSQVAYTVQNCSPRSNWRASPLRMGMIDDAPHTCPSCQAR